MLKIYNTLTKQKETFKPITPDEVKFYACGITVYDYCHIGHARSFIIFDIVWRYLKYLNYTVKFVRNITDIDDKIIKRANENQENTQTLTARYIEAMHDDMMQLNVLLPTLEPKATEFIPKIIELIQTLIDKEFAYKAPNGDVYFAVKKFKPYGQLSHRNLSDLLVGARIEASNQKRDPLDFAIWKNAKPDEPSFDSPWGKGRPGWHIECSAMVLNTLGASIDIHGGGMDLVFPHHENEIAQSEAATHKRFAKTWMHVGFLQIDDEKMSKSLGNFVTIKDALKKYHPETIRLFMISTHYRSPINYSDDAMQQIQNGLERLYIALRDTKTEKVIQNSLFEKQFIDAMDDDFNTPKAIAVLFDLAHEINRLKLIDFDLANQHAALLKRLSHVLGILQNNPNEFLQSTDTVDVELIEKLITERNQAKQQKNYAHADEIRQKLEAMNIILEDGPNQTTRWRQGPARDIGT